MKLKNIVCDGIKKSLTVPGTLYVFAKGYQNFTIGNV